MYHIFMCGDINFDSVCLEYCKKPLKETKSFKILYNSRILCSDSLWSIGAEGIFAP